MQQDKVFTSVTFRLKLMRIPVGNDRVAVSKHLEVSKENWRPQETHFGQQAGRHNLPEASGELEIFFVFFWLVRGH